MRNLINLRLSLLFSIVLISLMLPSRVNAQPFNETKYNPFAEQWVSYQIATGKVADLAQHYPNPADRVIRGSFVLALLQSKSRVIAEHGIWINNATVMDNLVLQYANINFPVSIENSTFEGFVSFCRSHFHKTLSFNGSTFKAATNLCAMKVDDSLFLSRTIFHDSLDISLAQIGVNITLDQAQFINDWPSLNFSSIEVGNTVFLGKAKFDGQLNFSSARIDGSILADDVVFQNPIATAYFDNIHVDGSIFLSRAVFNGPVRFYSAQIGEYFVGTEAQFKSSNADAYFENMYVGKTVYLGRTIFNGSANFTNVYSRNNFVIDHAQFTNSTREIVFSRLKVDEVLHLTESFFSGPVNLTYMNIGSFIEGTGTQFNSKDGIVNFGNTMAGHYIFFNKAEFAGPVDFRYVEIGQNFEAQDAQFTNPEQQPYFGYMKVEANLLIDRIVFSGSVNLGNVQIAESLSATEAQFNSSKYPVSLNDLRVKNVLLSGAVFVGPVNFSYSEIEINLNMNKAQFKNPQAKVDFTELTVGKSIFMADAIVDGAVAFDYIDVGSVMDLSNSRFNNSKEQTVSLASMNVKGHIFLNRTVFNGPVSFSRTAIDGLYATDVTWPAVERGTVNVTGMTYQEIDMRDSKENPVSFISLLEQSPFDVDSYQRLENYYRNLGHTETADYVYVRSQQRERTDGGMRWYYWRWWSNLFLDFFVLYGRDPLRVFLWCLLFVILGYFVFRNKEKMIMVAETDRPYRPFLYSLDLFLPFVDLGYAKVWRLGVGHKIAGAYAVVHQCLAWIFIPTAILAVAGTFV